MPRTTFHALVNRSIRRWFTTEMRTLGDLIESLFRTRCEVAYGLVPSAGGTPSELVPMSMTAGALRLGGVMEEFAAKTNTALFINGAPASGVAGHIDVNGDHTVIADMLVEDGDTCKAILVAIRTDGAGADAGAKLLLVHGTVEAGPTAPTILEVEQAIEAADSTNYNYTGNGGWVVIAELTLLKSGVTNKVISAVVDNRNNYLND